MSEPVRKDANGSAVRVKQGDSRTTKRVVVKSVPKKVSMWKDPVVRVLGVILAVIIVGGLLTLVMTLVRGDIDLSGAPQTLGDKELLVAEQNVKEDDATAMAWEKYVLALINADQLSKAESVFADMKSQKLDVTRNQEILFTQAALEQEKGNDEKALELYNEAIKQIYSVYKTKLDEGGDQNWALTYGPGDNYLTALLQVANIATAQQDYAAADKALSQYLEFKPNEAGIYIDRGNVRLKEEDYDGAAKDFKKALKFLPGDKEATQGLEKAEQGGGSN